MYKKMSSKELFTKIEFLTRFRRFSSGSPSSGVWILLRATKNSAYILFARVWHPEIIVISIVVNSIPLLELTDAVSAKVNKFFFPILPQWLRCLTWKVTLTKG